MRDITIDLHNKFDALIYDMDILLAERAVMKQQDDTKERLNKLMLKMYKATLLDPFASVELKQKIEKMMLEQMN